MEQLDHTEVNDGDLQLLPSVPSEQNLFQAPYLRNGYDTKAGIYFFFLLLLLVF